MSEPSSKPIPRFHVDQYGAIEFEGEHIPCAFGGEPGNLTAFIPVEGVCQIIGIPAENEIDRIRGHHLLEDGLFRVPFHALSPEGKMGTREVPAITLRRLHTWLAMIPPEIVTSDEMRAKLVVTQKELSDVIYAYFGRKLLPPEIRAEDDPYIANDRKQIYAKIEEASLLADQAANRLNRMEGQVADIQEKVERLMITISAGEEADNIDADQQEQLKAMIDILGHRYEEKHGKGTRGALINDLKDQHEFRFYNTVKKKNWTALVRDCVQRFRQMNSKGTALPRVFEIALRAVEQDNFF